MMADKPLIFRFDDVEVREHEFSLTKAGRVLSLEPKVFQALLFLLHNPNRLITKDQLLQAVWGDTAVAEGSLTRCISLLRSALGDDVRSPRYIETVPTVGYRFVAQIDTPMVANETSMAPVSPEGSKPFPATALTPIPPPLKPQGRLTPTRWWLWLGTAAVTLCAITGWVMFLERPLSPAIQSVTVLPLQNLSAEPDTRYFVAGMTEALSTELSALPGLKVVTNSSPDQVNDNPESLAQAAHKLGVDAVIEGSVLRATGKVTIDVRLFDVRRRRQLWAGTFEDAPENVTALQKHIAHEIAAHAGVPVPASTHVQTAAPKLLDPSAYDGYLQGRYLLSRRDAEGAVRVFRRAVVLDPNYARSWAGLAAGLAEWAMWTDAGLVPEAKAAARHAIELDPGNGEAWSVLGQIAFNQERDWEGAEYDLRRAAAFSPNDSTVESRYAIFLSEVGRHKEAVDHMQRALALDPMSFFNVRLMGSVYYWSRRYDESLEYIRKAEEMDPGLNAVSVPWEMENYQKKGMLDQAVLTDLRLFALPDGKKWHDRLQAAYRRGGPRAYWETKVSFVQAEPDSPCKGLDVATVQVLSGANNEALKNLDRSLTAGCFFMSMMRTEPLFDPLRGDPRFKDMLRKVNLGE